MALAQSQPLWALKPPNRSSASVRLTASQINKKEITKESKRDYLSDHSSFPAFRAYCCSQCKIQNPCLLLGILQALTTYFSTIYEVSFPKPLLHQYWPFVVTGCSAGGLLSQSFLPQLSARQLQHVVPSSAHVVCAPTYLPFLSTCCPSTASDYVFLIRPEAP